MRYAKIDEYEVVNGHLGGMSLYTQGCRWRCPNCFNPETHDFNNGYKWTSETKERFLELVGRPYIKRVSILGGEPLADESLEDVLDLVLEINKRYNTTQDIVLNGYDNHNILNENPNKIRLLLPNKTIWLYSGYEWNHVMYPVISDNFFNHQKRKQIVESVDVFVDGRYIDSQRDVTLKWRGSSNQRVIDTKKSIEKGEVVLWTT